MMLRKLEVNVISSQTLTVTKSAENLSAPCHQVSTVQYCTVLYCPVLEIYIIMGFPLQVEGVPALECIRVH